jgi:hypothetical protein
MPSPLRELLANSIVAVHLCVIVLYWCGAVSAVRGGFLRYPLALWQRLYLALAVLMSITVLLTDECYLTRWENALRAGLSPPSHYHESFLSHYVTDMPTSVDGVISVVLLFAGCVAMTCALWTWARAKDHRCY